MLIMPPLLPKRNAAKSMRNSFFRMFVRVIILLGVPWLPVIFSGVAAAAPVCEPTTKINAEKINERIIVVGELHGTNEMPAFVSSLACAFLRTGKPLLLGLEVPTDRQPAINEYMESQGSPADRKKLVDSAVGKLDDGRSSHAMLALIESMRKLRQAGAQVAVMGFDISVGDLPTPLYPNEPIWKGGRNMAMARNIESRARVYPDHIILNLVGGAHAGRRKGRDWDSEYESMGYLLSQRFAVHIIGLASAGGTFWGCAKPDSAGQLKCMTRATEAVGDNGEGYDAWVSIGTVSASIPMRK